MEEKLANILVNYSIKVKKDEKVLINYQDDNAINLINKIIEKINEVDGIVFVRKILDDRINYNLFKNYKNEKRIDMVGKELEWQVENFDSFIHITTSFNDYETINVDPLIKQKIGIRCRDARNIRTNQRKWVLLNYPNMLDAHKAKMNSVEYYDYAMRAMTVDYEKMYNDLIPLKELIDKTDKVRITSPNTDINFSIKDMPGIICAGEKNIPDGEVYTAPVRNSVNGKITYNTPSPYDGNVYNHVSLEFKDGKIINATCDEDNIELNKIFDKDEGARYIGEFSFGVNPMIMYPVGEILYDEKIMGSLHFTPGSSYDDCSNGNKSIVHWDMVLIQREDYGGGNIYFDDILIRENGKFVIDELKHLN